MEQHTCAKWEPNVKRTPLEEQLDEYVMQAEALPKRSKLRKSLLQDADRIRESLRKEERGLGVSIAA